MAEEGREIPQEYDLSLGWNEAEMPLNDVSISPINKRERTTTSVYLFGKKLSQESFSLDSKKTAVPFTDVSMSPTNKRSQTSISEVARKIKEMRFSSNEERKEEERTGALTQLAISLTQTKNMVLHESREILKESSFLESKETGVRLFGVTIRERGQTSMTRDLTSRWTIEKTLKASDLGHLTRLMLKKSDTESHIMTHLPAHLQTAIQQDNGVKVKVHDHDTDTEHDVVFKRWVNSSRSYILNGGWVEQFVRRRDLKQGDKIGLFWGTADSRLHFSVLSRAPAVCRSEEP